MPRQTGKSPRVVELMIVYRVPLEDLNATEVLDHLRERGSAEITAVKLVENV